MKRPYVRFSEEDSQRLLEAIASQQSEDSVNGDKGISWDKLEEKLHIPKARLWQHYHRVLKRPSKRRSSPWTRESITMLKGLRQSQTSWEDIGKVLGRSGHSCALKYYRLKRREQSSTPRDAEETSSVMDISQSDNDSSSDANVTSYSSSDATSHTRVLHYFTGVPSIPLAAQRSDARTAVEQAAMAPTHYELYMQQRAAEASKSYVPYMEHNVFLPVLSDTSLLPEPIVTTDSGDNRAEDGEKGDDNGVRGASGEIGESGDRADDMRTGFEATLPDWYFQK